LGVLPTDDASNNAPKLCLVSDGKTGEASRSGSRPAAACSIDPNLTPNLIGLSLKAALLKLAPLGVKTEFEGSGRVIQQMPPEGAPLDSDSTIRLILSEHDTPRTWEAAGKRYE